MKPVTTPCQVTFFRNPDTFSLLYTAIAGLVLIRQSAPEPRKREVDTIVIVAFLLNVAFTGLKLNAKRNVQQGETSGFSGFLAQAWAV